MASFNIVIKPSVEKDMRRLPKKVALNLDPGASRGLLVCTSKE